MPSFAELKAKATKAKDAGVEKMHNVKDRNTSVPMKKTNWDPYSGGPPPPLPPPRVNARSRPTEKPPLLPPPSRTANTAARTPSTPAASAPPLPGRPASGPPRLPARSPSSILASAVPPPLPSRGASASSLALSSSPGTPPPPPISRSTRPTLTHSADSQPPPPPPVPPPPAARAFSAPAPAPPPPPPVAQRKLETQSTGQSNTSFSDVRGRFGKEPRIDWTNLSQEDKHAFYGWLDEYFSQCLNITLPS